MQGKASRIPSDNALNVAPNLQAARTSKDELELQERANDALKRDVDRYQKRADLEAEACPVSCF